MNWEQTIYLFKAINPEKLYSQFSFTELSWNDVNNAYCNSGEILKIDGRYYRYAGIKKLETAEKRPDVIRFAERKKIVKELIN